MAWEQQLSNRQPQSTFSQPRPVLHCQRIFHPSSHSQCIFYPSLHYQRTLSPSGCLVCNCILRLLLICAAAPTSCCCCHTAVRRYPTLPPLERGPQRNRHQSVTRLSKKPSSCPAPKEQAANSVARLTSRPSCCPAYAALHRSLLRSNGVLKDLMALVMSCHTCAGGPACELSPGATPAANPGHTVSTIHVDGTASAHAVHELQDPAAPSRAVSRAPSRAMSRNPSRAMSRATSRPASAATYRRQAH